MSDKMREEFEEWAAEEAEVRGVGTLLGLMTDEHHDRYSMIWTQTAWMAWQASREALVVDLPEFFDCGAGGLVIGKDELIPALEAAGVKVKS